MPSRQEDAGLPAARTGTPNNMIPAITGVDRKRASGPRHNDRHVAELIRRSSAMANQVDPATVGGAASSGDAAQGQILAAQGASMVHGENEHSSVAATSNVAQLGPHPPFHGRRVSWVAVSIITAGFLIGGLALIVGHHGPT